MLAPQNIVIKDDDNQIQMTLQDIAHIDGLSGAGVTYELTPPVALKLFTDLGDLFRRRLDQLRQKNLSS